MMDGALSERGRRPVRSWSGSWEARRGGLQDAPSQLSLPPFDQDDEELATDENKDMFNLRRSARGTAGSAARAKETPLRPTGTPRMLKVVRTPDSVLRALHVERKAESGDAMDDTECPSPPSSCGPRADGELDLDFNLQQHDGAEPYGPGNGRRLSLEREEKARGEDDAEDADSEDLDEDLDVVGDSHAETSERPAEGPSSALQVAPRPGRVRGKQFGDSRLGSVLISLVEGLSECPTCDLAKWALLLALWGVALFAPSVPLHAVRTVWPASELGGGANSVVVPAPGEGHARDSVPGSQQGGGKRGSFAPPSLDIEWPQHEGRALTVGEHMVVQVRVRGLYPESFRTHRNPRVCLRLSSWRSDTTLGCLQVSGDVLSVTLEELEPGQTVLHASLLSEVKKLAKASRPFEVVSPSAVAGASSAAAADAAARVRKAEPGESCATTCTRTCTTTFEL